MLCPDSHWSSGGKPSALATALRMPKSIGFSVWLMAGTSLITSAQNAKITRKVSSVTATTAQRRRKKSASSARCR